MSELTPLPPPVKYSRLPGRGRRTQSLLPAFAAHNTLWLGPDHLLSVDRIWVQEEYKRFYFRDIQALTIQRNYNSNAWNAIHATLAFLAAFIFGIMAVEAHGAETRRVDLVIGGITCGLFLVFLIINFLRGPSCVCRIRTAVQTEILPSLNRTATAFRVLGTLKPLLDQTQGVVSSEQILAGLHAQPEPRSTPAPSMEPGLAPARMAAPPPLRRPTNGLPHFSLFSVMLVDGILGLFQAIHPSFHLPVLLNITILLGVTALGIAAIVRQRELDIPQRLRNLTFLSFLSNLFAWLIVSIYAIVARTIWTMNHRGQVNYAVGFTDSHGYRTFMAILNAVELALAISGFVMMLLYLGSRKQAAVARAGGSSPVPPSLPPL